MRPAFSSTRQAAAFALLLLLLLLLPALMGKAWLPPREQVYSSAPWAAGAYPYLHDQIFEEKGDIDIAFMGSSRIWSGIETAQVEAQLSEKMGRKAVVRSLCWNAPGCDALYFIMQDLLRHRKVHVMVFGDCSAGGGNTAHPRARYFFRVADNAKDIAGLTLRSKISFYTSAILGLPRNILGLLRTNLPVIPSDQVTFQGLGATMNPILELGSLMIKERAGHALESYTPQTGARPADVCVYSEATRQNFDFSKNLIYPMQAAFTRKIGALLQEHQVKLIFLHLPLSSEMNSPVIEETTFWPDLLGSNMTMMGVPPVKLFKGMSEENVLKLFYNDEHLNQYGQKYFTSIITPSLVRTYENQTKP